MKVLTLLFTFSTLIALHLANCVLILKHIKCDEKILDSNYNGTRCTISNITIKVTNYNWHNIKQSELHFENSTLPYIPSRLQMMMDQFVVLNMTSVKLQRIDGANFQDACSMREIHLKGNELQIIYNETFNESSLLEILDLSYNNISLIEPNAFYGLENLTFLDLSQNKLTSIALEFQNILTLKELNLSNNLILSTHPSMVGLMKNLNSLNFDSNQISDIKINICNALNLNLNIAKNDLENLTISWNPVCQASFGNTLEIIAATNRIRRVTADKQINLVSINLSRNNLTTIKGVTNIQHLSKLILSHNTIKNVSFETLKNLTSLKVFDMSFNDVEKIDDVQSLKKFVPTLEWIGLEGNKWNCVYLTEITKILKQVNVSNDVIKGDSACLGTTTQEIPTTQNDDDTTDENFDDQEEEFIQTDALIRMLIVFCCIAVIVAVVFKIALDCKYKKEVDFDRNSTTRSRL